MPIDALLRELRDGAGDVAHRVERVRDDDDDRVLRPLDDLGGDGRDDLLVRLHEVVAAHPGLAGQAGGDHDDVGAGRLLVAVRADDVRLEAEHRAGLVHVEGLPLREVRDDVDEDDVGVVAPGDLEGAGGADVPGTDDGDLLPTVHEWGSLCPAVRSCAQASSGGVARGGRAMGRRIVTRPRGATQVPSDDTPDCPSDREEERPMSDFKPGLEGVVAFETEIAEPDRDGGALRYRGVDIEELVGRRSVREGVGTARRRRPDEGPRAGRAVRGRRPDGRHARRPAVGDRAPVGRLEPAEDHRHLRRAGRGRSAPRLRDDALGRRPVRARRRRRDDEGARRRDRRRARRSPSASSSSGAARPIRRTSRRSTPTGSAPPSTASTPRPSPAASSPRPAPTAPPRSPPPSAALSGPLHGGAPARVLPMLDGAAAADSVDEYIVNLLDSGERLMGFGHRVYRAEDPRARLLRGTSKKLGSPRFAVAEELENVALAELQRRKPDRVLAHERRVLVGRRPRRRRCPRASSLPRCSPARAPRAGRRTSSSRSASGASCGRRQVRRPGAAQPRLRHRLSRARREPRRGRRSSRRSTRPPGARRSSRPSEVAVGRRDRVGGTPCGLPHARARLPVGGAVPLPRQARAAAPRPRRREPGRPRRGADHARGALARPPGRRQRVPPAAERDRRPRPAPAVRRLAIFCFKNGTPQPTRSASSTGSPRNDEDDRDVREAARKVALLLTKKQNTKR